MVCLENENVGNVGAYLPIKIRQGLPFVLVVRYKVNGELRNLSGYTPRMTVKKRASSRRVLVSPDCTIPELGVIRCFFSAGQTLSLKAGEEPTDPESLYQYELDLTHATNPSESVLLGPIMVQKQLAEVT